MTTREHKHTDECWEPDSGCDMGKNPEFVAVVKRPTRELIEAVRSDPEKWDSALGFENLVGVEDYDALRAALVAVLDECIVGLSGGSWREQFDARVNARALREKLK